jgi:membrane fusion protein (multidrug efflux system)
MKIAALKKILFIAIAIIVVLFFLVLAIAALRQHLTFTSTQKKENTPIVVTLSTVTASTFTEHIDTVGTLFSPQGIMVTPQISGIIDKINFTSGQFVEAGNLLFSLDKRTLQAAVDTANASYLLTQSNYQRNLKLYQEKMISISALQSADASMKEAKANLASATLALEQADITAPFSGNTGLIRVSLGQYVSPGDTLVELQSVDPITVSFFIPEENVESIQKGLAVNIHVAAYPNKVFSGTLSASNASLNAQTHMLELWANINNKEHLLLPGMFAQVGIILPTEHTALFIPALSVNYSPFGDTVFVVQNGRAVLRYITVGNEENNMIEVLSGLSEGEEIVSVGGNKLQNGSLITTARQAQKTAEAAGKAAVIQAEKKVKG